MGIKLEEATTLFQATISCLWWRGIDVKAKVELSTRYHQMLEIWMLSSCGNAAFQVINASVGKERYEYGYQRPGGDADIVLVLGIHFVIVDDYVTVPWAVCSQELVPGLLAAVRGDELTESIEGLEATSWLATPFENERGDGDVDAVANMKR